MKTITPYSAPLFGMPSNPAECPDLKPSFSSMAEPSSILDPNNPIFDSEEEDDDFEPGI